MAVCLGAVACAAPESEASDDEFVVVTTFTVMADMAQEVAGDRARVESLTRAGVEIHGYQPTASDVIRGSEADLVLHHGLGLEAWFAEFVERIDAPSVTITDQIEPLPIAGEVGAPNPHAWMSPRLAETYVRSIESALADADPEGADTYRANAEAYIAQIREVGDDLEAALETIPTERRVLVTCEGAFSYLAADAGLEEYYLWPVNAESQATAQSVRAAIDVVRERDVPTVFCESTVNTDSMESVAAESGAHYGGELYVDSLSAPEGPVPTYLDLLRVNSRTLTDGLAGDRP